MKSRKRTQEPDGIIIHAMGEFIRDTYAYDFLENEGLSAHYLIDRRGWIIHCVPPTEIAYHAGISKFGLQQNLNSTFIGIELLVPGHHDYVTFLQAIRKKETFSQEQYESTAKLCRDLINTYPSIKKARIVRHSEVSGGDIRIDPKQDPGKGFNMTKLLNLI